MCSMDYRSLARQTLKVGSEGDPVLEEKITFNAAVAHFKTAKLSAVDVKTFRRVYNSRLQKLLLCPQIRQKIWNKTMSPGDVTNEINKSFTPLPHLHDDSDERTALRCFALRTFKEIIGRDCSDLESEIAARQETAEEYKSQVRRLISNLRMEKTGLLQKVKDCVISTSVLATATRRELWPELHQQPHMQPHCKTIILGAEDVKDSLLKCGRCKQNTVSYYEMQTRSADEPMTVFCTCATCGNKWKM